MKVSKIITVKGTATVLKRNATIVNQNSNATTVYPWQSG